MTMSVPSFGNPFFALVPRLPNLFLCSIQDPHWKSRLVPLAWSPFRGNLEILKLGVARKLAVAPASVGLQMLASSSWPLLCMSELARGCPRAETQ